MSFNSGYIGTGAYATNAKCLMQERMAGAQSRAQSAGSGSFSAAMAQSAPAAGSVVANISSPEAAQHRQQALSSLQSIAQSYQTGADISQSAQSLSGNSYASMNDFLSALSQTASQSVSTGSVNTQA